MIFPVYLEKRTPRHSSCYSRVFQKHCVTPSMPEWGSFRQDNQGDSPNKKNLKSDPPMATKACLSCRNQILDGEP